MASESILAKTARGAGWMVAWHISARLLGLVTTLLLARLLTPSDFGVVAIAMSFAQGLEALAFIGVEDALVRAKAPDRALYDTGFTLNLLRGLLLAVLLAAASLPMAGVFGDPRLPPLLLALAGGVAFSGLDNVGTTEFRRDFRFSMAFRQLIVPRLLSLGLTLGLALWLRSYWALVAGTVSMRVLAVAAGYVLHPYRPSLSLARWRDLIGYSLWSFAQTAAAVVRERTHMLLIGHMLGPRPAGLYSLGEELALMPANQLLQPVSHAAFSGFAASDDAAGTYRRLAATAALLTLPMGFGISLTANALVALAFGPGWAAAVPVMRVLGVVAAGMGFAYMGATLYFAHALMGQSFRVTVAGAVVRIGALVWALPALGLVGAAWAMAAAELVETVAYVELVARRFGMRRRDLLADVWRSVAATGVMAAVLWGVGLGWTAYPAWRLAEAVPLGAAVYGAVLLGLWWASGRPAGAERDCLKLAAKLLGNG